ncbi:MAG: LTA synthase family protein [Desulfovibrionaceae bacterium]|nr:LTA synthase family protein [Desulfovibrionaceae bacterium]
MWELSLSLGCAILVAILVQRLTTPGPKANFLKADLAAAYVGGFFFACLDLLTFRPLVALLLTILGFLVLGLTNQAKQKALREEPLFFADVTLISQVWHFPWLYLPFLPYKLVLLSLVVTLPLLVLAYNFSHPCFSTFLTLFFLPLLLVLMALKFKALGHFLANKLSQIPLEFTSKDVQTYGPFGAALLHTLWHLFCRGQILGIKTSTTTPYAKLGFSESLLENFAKSGARPNLILWQEESFCDARRYDARIPADFLPTFDALSLDSFKTNLAVSAYGAYTMRTEYEVLTGIKREYLGTDAFHPYWRASKITSWSLAHFFKSLGYYTLCVHPFAKAFFYRHLALPRLGFDDFISLENFPHKDTFGPYISDLSVAKTCVEILNSQKVPVFIFVITMENHGPWLEERFKGASRDLLVNFKDLDPRVNRYLTHLRNADLMLKFLSESLKKLERKTLLNLYGDHLPGLKPLIPSDSRATPCLVWSTSKFTNKELAKIYQGRTTILPAEIGGILLQGASLLS